MSVVEESNSLADEVAGEIAERGILADGNEKEPLVTSTEESKAFEEAFEPEPSIKSEADSLASDDDEDGEDSQDIDFRSRIWNAEQDCRKCELAVEIAKDELKEAKGAYDDAVERLRKIANESNQPSLFDQPKKVEPQPEPEPAPVEAWKSRDFKSWLSLVEIEGLGTTKRDALSEVVDTFEDFENLRIEAKQKNCHLAHLLPSGWGNKITDRLEEAFLTAKNEPYIDRMQPLAVIKDKMPSAQRNELESKWRDYAKIICEENEIDRMDLEDCKPGEDFSNEMQEGYDAFEDGLAVHVCDADTIDGQSDWVYGWCLARRKEKLLIEAEESGSDSDE